MNAVTAVWSIVTASCLVLSAIHLVIGVRQPRRFDLWFALSAFSAAAVAAFELALMKTDDPARYGLILRWTHVPLFLLVASFVLFIRTFFNAGRPWLAGATIAVRGAASLVVNFLQSPNVNYSEITGLRRIPFLGDTVSVAEGIVSPWTRLGELSSLLLLVFLLDATRTLWRRGDRRRAALFGGCALVFVTVAAIGSALIHRGVYRVPYLVSVPYFVILAAMSYELTSDVLHASDLSRRLGVSEDALRESDSRLALAANAVNLGFWDWNARTDEMWMTPKGRDMRAYSREEKLDLRRFLSSVHPEDRERVRRVIESAAEKGSEFEMEYRIVRPGGEMHWIALRGSGERRTGADPHVLGMSIDFTRRKLAESEALRRQSEVAHLSRVTMLGELSGSIAHELNQPLTAILSNAQAGERFLARADCDPSEIREILGDIVKESKRAGEVIRRLRLLLKKGEIKLEQLHLAEMVDDVFRLLNSEFVNRAISASSKIDAGLPPVVADGVQIQQVLFNLVTNACDAMAEVPAEGRRLFLRAEAENGNRVRVSVTDHGPGLSAADLERVFEPFVTTKSEGMGLGLTVCRSIITAHGGRLWATNNAGGGATFHFTLPASPGES
jgi:two-component system, LuxR family, sensor kinase FixL